MPVNLKVYNWLFWIGYHLAKFWIVKGREINPFPEGCPESDGWNAAIGVKQ